MHRMLAVANYHRICMGFEPWNTREIDRLVHYARTSIESDGADEYCDWAMQCPYLLKAQYELAVVSLRRALERDSSHRVARW